MLGVQDVYTDEKGVERFKENLLVSMLIDNFEYNGLKGFNALSVYYQVNDIPEENYSQITQLIGYSLSGWHTLSTTSDEESSMMDFILEDV